MVGLFIGIWFPLEHPHPNKTLLKYWFSSSLMLQFALPLGEEFGKLPYGFLCKKSPR